MSDQKLTKGNYYSCKHQELGEKKCETDTCHEGATLDITKRDLKCSKCKKSIGDVVKNNITGQKTYILIEDCYWKDKDAFVCDKCHEKNKNDNPERDRETNPAITKQNCRTRSNY